MVFLSTVANLESFPDKHRWLPTLALTTAAFKPGGLCLVAGVGRGGIGDNTAAYFAKHGYKVAVLARKQENVDYLVGQIINELKYTDANGAKGYSCDCGEPSQVEETVNKIIADFSQVPNVLVYNAGAGFFKSIDATSIEDFELCYRSGPLGLFVFAKHLIPKMVEAQTAGVPFAVAVTGATASWRGMPATPAFAPSKFALRALAQSLAKVIKCSRA